MAQPTTLRFSKFKVLIGDGNTPEAFTAPCGFTKKSLKMSAQSSSTTVPDCDDPDAPAWEEKDIVALSASVNGQGVLAMGSLAMWRTWYLSGASRNVRVVYDLTGEEGGGYWQGAAILTDLSDDVDMKSEGGRTQRQVSIENDGPWVWVDNP